MILIRQGLGMAAKHQRNTSKGNRTVAVVHASSNKTVKPTLTGQNQYQVSTELASRIDDTAFSLAQGLDGPHLQLINGYSPSNTGLSPHINLIDHDTLAQTTPEERAQFIGQTIAATNTGHGLVYLSQQLAQLQQNKQITSGAHQKLRKVIHQRFEELLAQLYQNLPTPDKEPPKNSTHKYYNSLLEQLDQVHEWVLALYETAPSLLKKRTLEPGQSNQQVLLNSAIYAYESSTELLKPNYRDLATTRDRLERSIYYFNEIMTQVVQLTLPKKQAKLQLQRLYNRAQAAHAPLKTQLFEAFKLAEELEPEEQKLAQLRQQRVVTLLELHNLELHQTLIKQEASNFSPAKSSRKLKERKVSQVIHDNFEIQQQALQRNCADLIKKLKHSNKEIRKQQQTQKKQRQRLEFLTERYGEVLASLKQPIILDITSHLSNALEQHLNQAVSKQTIAPGEVAELKRFLTQLADNTLSSQQQELFVSHYLSLRKAHINSENSLLILDFGWSLNQVTGSTLKHSLKEAEGFISALDSGTLQSKPKKQA